MNKIILGVMAVQKIAIKRLLRAVGGMMLKVEKKIEISENYYV